MRELFAGLIALALIACGGNHGDDDDGGGDDGPGMDGPAGCVGLECQVVDCAKQGQAPTALTGTVYAPNGTLPLYGVNVYVPRDKPAAFTEGAQCSRCGELSGAPIVSAQTDDKGQFRLENVPAGDNIPLVITTGKWRRQITIPHVDACGQAAVTTVDTRLPKNKSEGDIPKIALTTGNSDALECLIRKLGVDDAEVTTDAGAGRIHFFRGNGLATLVGGTTLPNATTLWSSADKLKQYDIVLLSCEGNQHPETKPQEALDAMKQYADAGGRVFASHWHNIWLEGSTQQANYTQKPRVWPDIATWTNAGNTALGTIDLIDEVANPKGASFAQWMLGVAGSTVRGEVPIADEPNGQQSTGRTTCDKVDAAKAERWTYLKGQGGYTQNFQFTTPNESPLADRCGKVVFSDMHVSGAPQTGMAYPAACPLTPLTPQEKALAFMFFDIASCVGPIF
jgi:hypothetical protein